LANGLEAAAQLQARLMELEADEAALLDDEAAAREAWLAATRELFQMLELPEALINSYVATINEHFDPSTFELDEEETPRPLAITSRAAALRYIRMAGATIERAVQLAASDMQLVGVPPPAGGLAQSSQGDGSDGSMSDEEELLTLKEAVERAFARETEKLFARINKRAAQKGISESAEFEHARAGLAEVQPEAISIQIWVTAGRDGSKHLPLDASTCRQKLQKWREVWEELGTLLDWEEEPRPDLWFAGLCPKTLAGPLSRSGGDTTGVIGGASSGRGKGIRGGDGGL